MFLYQIGNRHIRNSRKFPGVVHLHFGCHLEPDLLGIFPGIQRTFTGANLGDGVVHKSLFHSADVCYFPPFTDTFHIDVFGQQIHHSLFEFQCIFFRGMGSAPCPVIRDHTRFRIGFVHSPFHGVQNIGNNGFRFDFAAIGTLMGFTAVMAVGGIFRHGDTENSPQSFCIRKEFLHGAFQIFQHFRSPVDTVGLCMIQRHIQPAPMGFLFIEGKRHTTRFIQIEINLQSIFCTAIHDLFQIGKTFFMPGRVFFRPGNGIEQIQQSMDPDPFDPHGRILGKKIFRHRIQNVCIAQYIPATCRKGVDEVEIKTETVLCGDRAFHRSKTVQKRKRLIHISTLFRREILCNGFPEFGRGFVLFFRQRLITHFGDFGFEFSHFCPEEIFFLKRICHFFGSPAQ